MVPFEFQPRTRIVFGRRSLGRLGQLASELRFSRTLLVADEGIVAAGHAAEALRLLESAGVATACFSEFGVNPDTSAVETGRRTAASHEVDSIVALGGGSSLDCARAINFVLTGGGRIANYRGYGGKTSAPLLPMIAIPTTAGTGSEAQSSTVILDSETNTRMLCGDPSAAARLAILDPDLTVTAPRHVTAMAGFDAIAHAVEAAVTAKRTAISDLFAFQAWRLLTDAFERVLLHPADPEARGGMQLGAYFAGMAVEQSMVGAAHACADPLTARFKMSHGLALAILLPHVVRWNAGVARDRYQGLLGSPRRRVRDEDAAEGVARRLEDLAAAAALAMTLSDAGVEEGTLPALAAEAAQHWAAPFNPRPLDAAGALDIYKSAF